MQVCQRRASAPCTSFAALRRRPDSTRRRRVALPVRDLRPTSRHVRKWLSPPILPGTAASEFKLRAAPSSDELSHAVASKGSSDAASDKQVECWHSQLDAGLLLTGLSDLTEAYHDAFCICEILTLCILVSQWIRVIAIVAGVMLLASLQRQTTSVLAVPLAV